MTIAGKKADGSESREKWICTAKTLAGFEEVAAEELRSMAFEKVKPLKRAVSFECDLRGVYMANLNMRTAMSILLPVADFRFKSNDDFIRNCSAIAWNKLFDVRKTFSVKTTVFSKAFGNTNYPGLLVKDSIVDCFREKTGKRPVVDKERPDIVIDVYISEFHCVISLNSSGRPLYLRGYRNMPFDAPLNECLAAGLILLSGWNARGNFINPMCGSGTLVAEAAMMAFAVHPQKFRNDFAFMNWSNFNAAMLEECRKKLTGLEKKEFPFEIRASDNSNRALSITRNSLSFIGLAPNVKLEKINFMDSSDKGGQGSLILNPPYGERLAEDDLDKLYASIGTTLKNKYHGITAWIFAADTKALNMIGLKPFRKHHLFNGKIPCKFLGFDLFEGSRK